MIKYPTEDVMVRMYGMVDAVKDVFPDFSWESVAAFFDGEKNYWILVFVTDQEADLLSVRAITRLRPLSDDGQVTIHWNSMPLMPPSEIVARGGAILAFGKTGSSRGTVQRATSTMSDRTRRRREVIDQLSQAKEMLGDEGIDLGLAGAIAARSEMLIAELQELDNELRPEIQSKPEVKSSLPPLFAKDLGPTVGRQARGVEYKSVQIDWTVENLGKAAEPVKRNSWRFDRKMLVVQQLVMFFLDDVFKDGWQLDGTYEQAVQHVWTENWLGNERLWKVVARLRRET